MFKLIKFNLINIWGINIYTIFFFLAHSASAPALLRRFEGNVARTDVHSLETMCSRAIHAIREKKEKLSLDAVFFFTPRRSVAFTMNTHRNCQVLEMTTATRPSRLYRVKILSVSQNFSFLPRNLVLTLDSLLCSLPLSFVLSLSHSLSFLLTSASRVPSEENNGSVVAPRSPASRECLSRRYLRRELEVQSKLQMHASRKVYLHP